MNFPTLPYDHVTNSFLLEICFWGPTYPTFLYNVTLFSLFFLNSSLSNILSLTLQALIYPCPLSLIWTHLICTMSIGGMSVDEL